jgi:hypothetical protein
MAGKSVAAFVIAGLTILSGMSMLPVVLAEGSKPELVPAPWILETHEFNVSKSGGGASGGYYTNEGWGVEISHGGSRTAIQVRNITNGGETIDQAFVDYANYVDYHIGEKLYTAQFYINELAFDIGGNRIGTNLRTCSDFTLNRSPVKYDGTVPTFNCNITLYGIRVYSTAPHLAGSRDSTFDFTLLHHIRGDWNNSQMKIEALYNFSKTRFYNSVNGSEYPAGTLFTAEIDYRIYVGEEHNGTIIPIIPTSRTDKALTFNLTGNNGAPLTVSRLEMKDNYTVYNATGSRASLGSSSMGVSNDLFTPVTHMFPNLTYRDTQSIRSDPKMTTYHDMITEENNRNPWAPGLGGISNFVPVIAACIIVAICVMGAIFYLKKRKKGEKTPADVSTATPPPAVKPRMLKKP